MGRAGMGGGHSSGGHSISRSSGGHSTSSSRARGSSFGGGYHGGGMHIHNTYVGGGYHGGFFYDAWESIKIVLFIALILILVMCSSSSNKTKHNEPTTVVSNVVREKLENVPSFDSNCIEDELAWFDNINSAEKSLKTFYDKTGIQPYIYLKAYDASLKTNEEKEEYANKFYEENFDNENVFLYAYFAESNADEDVGYMVYVNGKQVDSIMDSEAIAIFWKNIDKYWYSDMSTDDVFINAFNNTATTIMKNSETKKDSKVWIYCLGGIGIGAVIFVIKKVVDNNKAKKEQEEIKKAEDELMQRKMDAGTFKLSDLKDKKDE